jgi:nitrite reductase (NO-forming)
MRSHVPHPTKPQSRTERRRGTHDGGPTSERPSVTGPAGDGGGQWRRRIYDGGLILGMVAIVLGMIAGAWWVADGGLSSEGGSGGKTVVADPNAVSAAPTLADAKGVAFEKYERPDPTLPAPPKGAVKKFKVDVYEHVTQVSKDLAPTQVWSYAINGKEHRGTGVSEPMVVTQGDKVEIELINGSSDKMSVKMPHSIDYHSSEIAPNKAFKTIAPGETLKFSFVAEHVGVFMYHCATDPVLLHTGAGMMGAMIVKPKNLPAVDRELYMIQQEFYIGKPGAPADMGKLQAKRPDVIAFNGYANQYKDEPIAVNKGETIRMYVLNAGPSIWSAFHVIGTVFDRTVIEGTVGKDAQTVNLAPSQGGWVEFTLDEEGNFPFVTHAFGDMTKGALGVLHTAKAPVAGEDGHAH